MKQLQALLKAIRSGQLTPVYTLFGEEPFFREQVLEALEQHVLGEADRSFNYHLVYGEETSPGQLVGLAKAFPVMAQKRLVVLKHAEKLRKNQQDLLAKYLEQPAETTVLVFVYENRKGPDKRTALGKALNKFPSLESKKLYEDKLPGWITQQVKADGWQISAEAAHMLAQALGADLKRVMEELQKMYLELERTGAAEIDKQLVLAFVNIDRDYNIFELQNRIGQRKAAEAQLIISMMMQNPKDNPPIQLISQLFNYFLRLGILQQQRITQERDATRVLGQAPFIARQYLAAARKYTFAQVTGNLVHLRNADYQLKGIHRTSMDEGHIMKTLIWQLTA